MTAAMTLVSASRFHLRWAAFDGYEPGLPADLIGPRQA
jgi:hypothetical protein